ncbi:MADS-box transcription factor [Mycena floridula]|nr:MADS-box transcription factor [Mycena floridula]
MGRRKIEIQPIPHERNRSVTFLKRKNGLFKKAYELGVLCSVDVAVIIFEERAGHHMKLYQYCSGDIHNIVQRHLRYDGEKDTKGPADFSGNPPNKFDDGDGDEEEAEDDDDVLPTRPQKRVRDGKPKSGPTGNNVNNMTVDLEYQPTSQHRTMAIPQPPMPMHGMQSRARQASTLPVSSDRYSDVHQNHGMNAVKKPQRSTLHVSPHSRSPSDETAFPFSGGGSAGPGNFRTSSGNNSYPAFFNTQPHSSPSSFIPGGFPSRNSTGTGYGPPRTPTGGPYDASGRYVLPQQYPGTTGSGSGGNPDLFAGFLGSEGQARGGTSGSNSGGTLDWPVHSSGGNPSSGHGPASSGPSSAGNTGGGGQWLDFLSGNPAGPGGGNSAASRSGGTPGDRSAESWERGGETTGSPRLNSHGKRSETDDEGRSNGIGRTSIDIKMEGKDTG